MFGGERGPPSGKLDRGLTRVDRFAASHVLTPTTKETELADESLVAGLRERDAHALERVLEAHGAEIQAVAYLILRRRRGFRPQVVSLDLARDVADPDRSPIDRLVLRRDQPKNRLMASVSSEKAHRSVILPSRMW